MDDLMFEDPTQYEGHTYIETFMNWDDAITWVEGKRVSYPTLAWNMNVSISTVNYALRVGLSFQKIQQALDFNNEPENGNERKAN